LFNGERSDSNGLRVARSRALDHASQSKRSSGERIVIWRTLKSSLF